MKALLSFALGIDKINEKLGVFAAFGVLFACLISATNAIVRYGFNFSSNAFLEVQWYLFAAVVMLGASTVLKQNEHVRVDVIYGKLKGNLPVYVDIFGLIVFLLPVMLALMYMSWPLFYKMLLSGEMSSQAGGLVRWPAMLMLPLGFFLISLQGVSELIKRIFYLRGEFEMSMNYEKPLQ
jgi:TRAP-type mannitol/chloroaromatic compound transport system permease small subunit